MRIDQNLDGDEILILEARPEQAGPFEIVSNHRVRSKYSCGFPMVET